MICLSIALAIVVLICSNFLFSDGFCDAFENNKKILTNVKRIVFRYDVANSVSSEGSYSYYDVAMAKDGMHYDWGRMKTHFSQWWWMDRND
jgi:hypothetical protein